MPTEIGPKSFGTVEKQVPGPQVSIGSEAHRREIAVLPTFPYHSVLCLGNNNATINT